MDLYIILKYRPQDTKNSEDSIKTLKNNKELKKKKEKLKSDQKDHLIIENIVKDKHIRSHDSKKEIVTDDHLSNTNQEKKKYVVGESKRQKSVKKINDHKDKRLKLSETNYSLIKDDSQKKRQKLKEERSKAERNRQKVNEKSINFVAENFKPKLKEKEKKDDKYFSNINGNNFDDQLKLKLANDSNSIHLNDKSSNDLKSIGNKVKLGSFSQKEEFMFSAKDDIKLVSFILVEKLKIYFLFYCIYIYILKFFVLFNFK